jgi:hypothetical protein
MQKSIHTLIPDIYRLVGGEHGITNSLASDVGADIASAIQQSLSPSDRRGLRLSGLGPKCPKHMWHHVNTPELAEPLPPHARIKYTYGHIIEHLLIGLARASGHEVTGEQDELVVDGIVGHRDCVIDGAIVDVKSSSSRGMEKFKNKTLHQDDSFGYLDQLDAYLVGSLHDPLVTVKDRAYIIAVDKTLGHLVLYEHKLREHRIRKRIEELKQLVQLPTPPACECGTKSEGKSGNISLDVKASYSPFKHICFPSLRTFLYASGPVYLTKVVRTPDVPEINRLTLH